MFYAIINVLMRSYAMKHTKNKKMLVFALTIVLSLAILFAILEKTNTIDIFKSNPVTDMNIDGPTDEQKQQTAESEAEAKQQLIDNPKDGMVGTTPAGSANSSSITLSAQQEENNTVTVFTKLNGYSTGSCDLSVTNQGKSISQTASVIYQPEFSSCAGFTVSKDSFGAGSWNIKLSVTSNGKTESNNISFEVN